MPVKGIIVILVIAIVFAIAYHERIAMWLASHFNDDDHNNNEESKEEENE